MQHLILWLLEDVFKTIQINVIIIGIACFWLEDLLI
jgi:hypothetical protein